MKFTKYHGIGNDFIIIDGIREKLPDNLNETAKNLCHRNYGIGADGLMVVLPSDKADIRMRIINSDGSEAEMCGNGIRCFARYVYEYGHVQQLQFTVETLAGIMVPVLVTEAGQVKGITVDMGVPSLNRIDIPMLGDTKQAINEKLQVLDTSFNVTSVLLGVPHCIVFVDDVEKVDLQKYGPALESHPAYPRKTNVHFVEVINDHEMKMRIWERGAGITLACGTGACGTLVAAHVNKKTGKIAKIELPGGVLNIEWADNNHIYMTGPAELVFSGEVLDSSLIK
ncbi:MAG: diaminopimelate epimerase [Firmicutes bacterium HGW-Firmicutes-12]|jgi:diaminopimelate epimerase|nr:MAG: diaminopimelate epimerase [Firmicutes bacterium HGW-Firmicutes-12]